MGTVAVESVVRGMEVSLIRDLDEALGLAEEWDALADAIDAGPLSRPTYMLGWWRHLGPGRLLVAAVREDGRLVALAPLHERRVGPVTVARWLGHGLGTVAEALVLPGHEDAASRMWAALATRSRVLELVECRAGSAGLAELSDLDVPGRRTTVAPRDLCPVADLEGDGLNVVRRPGAKNLRNTLKKADRELARSGTTFRLEVTSDPSGFEALLPSIRSVFDAAEAANPRQHLLRPPYEDFFVEYVLRELASDRAVVLCGYLGNRLVAFWVALRSRNTLSLFFGRFAPDVAAFRPGHLLFRETYQWAAGQGLRRVDLLLGESQTKRQWSTGSYGTLEVTSGTPAARAVARAAVQAADNARRVTSRVRP